MGSPSTGLMLRPVVADDPPQTSIPMHGASNTRGTRCGEFHPHHDWAEGPSQSHRIGFRSPPPRALSKASRTQTHPYPPRKPKHSHADPNVAGERDSMDEEGGRSTLPGRPDAYFSMGVYSDRTAHEPVSTQDSPPPPHTPSFLRHSLPYSQPSTPSPTPSVSWSDQCHTVPPSEPRQTPFDAESTEETAGPSCFTNSHHFTIGTLNTNLATNVPNFRTLFERKCACLCLKSSSESVT